MKKKSEIRRRRILHRRMIKFLFALTAVILFATGFGAIHSYALENKPVSYKYYTSIVIKKGDTLDSIAASHMTSQYSSRKKYVAEVCSINHLDDQSIIKAGNHIIVPYYSVMKK